MHTLRFSSFIYNDNFICNDWDENDFRSSDDDLNHIYIIDDIETVIESVKRNFIKRTSPLTLILDHLEIKVAIGIMKRVEQENDVSLKL